MPHPLRLTLIACMAVLQACAPGAEEMPSPAAPGSAQPRLVQTGDTVVLSWVERRDDSATLRFATLAGDGWSAPRTVASGADWFVNWADFPSVVPIKEDFWAAHWLVKKPGGTYAYDVHTAVSGDAGANWSVAQRPHDDDTPTEHGFVSLFPHGDDAGVLWLDGRNMAHDGARDGEHDTDGNMTLRASSLARNGAPAPGVVVDDRVCDCCQTGVAVAGTTPVAVYRDRSGDEIRDIYVARLVDGRWTAGAPVARDDWMIPGCPVNGPAVAARGDDVVVAWFTAAGDRPLVRYARSTDAGASFAVPIDVEDRSPLGRVAVVLMPAGDAIVSYLRRGRLGDGAQIVARRISSEGVVGEASVVAVSRGSRSAGFPQMALAGDDLLFAWTDVRGEQSIVKTALLRGGL